MIRYELDDKAEKCGDRYKITGHRDGIIYGKNNEMISLAAINLHSEKLNMVTGFQMYQKEKGKLLVKIVPSKTYGQGDYEIVRNIFQKQAGNSVDVTIELASSLELTQRGKFKLLIQEIK